MTNALSTIKWFEESFSLNDINLPSGAPLSKSPTVALREVELIPFCNYPYPYPLGENFIGESRDIFFSGELFLKLPNLKLLELMYLIGGPLLGLIVGFSAIFAAS
jgi:hypothetical protein